MEKPAEVYEEVTPQKGDLPKIYVETPCEACQASQGKAILENRDEIFKILLIVVVMWLATLWLISQVRWLSSAVAQLSA